MQERINRFKHKVSKVHSETILKTTRRSTEVNVQAANRFITAAIPELSRDQKLALKQVQANTMLKHYPAAAHLDYCCAFQSQCHGDASTFTFPCVTQLCINSQCSFGLAFIAFCVQAGAKRKADASGLPQHVEQNKPVKDQALKFLEETMQGLGQ